MGAHQDMIQRAVVRGAAMVGTLLNGACDTLIGVAIHIFILLLIGFLGSMTPISNFIPKPSGNDCILLSDMIF
jgi:hypothetical protein